MFNMHVYLTTLHVQETFIQVGYILLYHAFPETVIFVFVRMYGCSQSLRVSLSYTDFRNSVYSIHINIFILAVNTRILFK